MSHFEESSGIDEGSSNESIAVVEVPYNPSILSKRSLSKTNGMDVDENISHKKIKTHPQYEQVSGDIVSEDSKRMVLFPKKSIQLHQYSFGGEGSTEPSSCFKSRAYLVSSYAKKQMQSSKEAINLIPRVISLMNQKTLLISTRDVERNTLKFAVVNDKKVYEMEVNLDKISVPDKI